MKLMFIVSSLACGGAEKNISMLSNYFCNKNYDVFIVTMGTNRDYNYFYLDKKVVVNYLNCNQITKNIIDGIKNNYIRIVKLKNFIERIRPNIIISFMDKTNILTLLSTIGSKIPIIISERNDPHKNDPGRIWNLLRKITYPFAKYIVLQTDGFRGYFSKRLQDKLVTIPNALDESIWNSQANGDMGDIGNPYILAMGKLKRQKGFDTLIQAYSMIKNELPEWSLTIFGNGQDYHKLKMFIDKLQLSNHVHLMGRTRTPVYYMQHAAIFVLSSRYEGFPNVLSEAMACGLPVIATNCSPAITDMIEHQYNGLIVGNDPEMMANAIMALVKDTELMRKLGENAKRVKNIYSIQKIAIEWERLFMNSNLKTIPVGEK